MGSVTGGRRPFVERADTRVSGAVMPRRRTAGWPSQTTVEFALVVLLVVGSALVLAQVAWYVYARHVVATAVAEGARVGSAGDRSPEDGAAYARRVVDLGLGANGQAVSVAATLDGEQVVVEAQGRLPLLVAWPGDRAPGLDARAAVPKERFRPGAQQP